MNHIRLELSVESLRQSKSGALHGSIYITIDGEDFPESGWDDLAIGFICAWLRAIIHLISRGGSERVDFMDGPYWVDFSKAQIDDNRVDIDFVSGDRKIPFVTRSATGNVRDLLSEAVEVGECALALCCKKGWNGPDVRKLSDTIPAAHQLIRSGAVGSLGNDGMPKPELGNP